MLFDELTTFSSVQFWYLLSRNRSTCGVAPRIRATTNPDADSWVARFLDYWIGDDGYPIEERSGELRWFVRIGDSIEWARSPVDLMKFRDPQGKPIPPKSVTFIPAKLTDNQILMKQDPNYIANLMSLNTIDRERLLLGNWKIRPSAGDFFKREWVGSPVAILPSFKDTLRKVRGWDLGATTEREGRDPDWTCGTLIGEEPGKKKYYVLNHKYARLSPDGVEKLILDTAKEDGRQTTIEIPQDPAQAGKAQKMTLLRLLAGYDVRFRPASGDKVTRFKGFSAQAEGGNVTVALGDWNDRWMRELENFPPKHGHDDDADSTAQAFNGLLRAKPTPVVASYSGFH
ncbi:MAG: phage terminase large subunit [Candidatus Dadabacteria bacterium]|nr:phage terminase large subunit [Candidatus Dadabacteria bacterium]